jgi:hypothetical protein
LVNVAVVLQWRAEQLCGIEVSWLIAWGFCATMASKSVKIRRDACMGTDVADVSTLAG